MKKKKRAVFRFVIGMSVIIGVILLYYVVSYSFWFIAAWGGPTYYEQLVNKMSTYHSDVLIRKINSFDVFSPRPGMAIDILAERKEKKAIPVLIKLLKSKRAYLKYHAFSALVRINDPRAIDPLMDIVRQGEKHSYYIDALMTLATMKYEGALEYVLERAKRADAYENGSIGMLKDFGKPEYIPLLIEIKNKIPDDYYFAKFDRGRIDDAIAHLKSLQQSQSPQEITK